MPILKIEKRDSPFVIMDQRPLNDARLSWKAKGLLAYLLSKPDDWQVWMDDLEKRSTDGEHAVRSAIRELRDCGYVRYGRERQPDGTFGPAVYYVSEIPEGGFPNVENPNWDNPNVDNHVHTNKDSTNKDSTSNEKKVSATPTERKPDPTNDLVRACEKVWGYPAPTWGQESKAAKHMLKRETAEDILGCLSWMMTDQFYQDRQASFALGGEQADRPLEEARSSYQSERRQRRWTKDAKRARLC
jgi:hypothetical protein